MHHATNQHVQREKLLSTVRALPDAPGVYFFMGRKREVLYVGKATSLRDRVRSYFGADLAATRGPHLVTMVEETVRVEHRTTDTVLDALVLEAKLIREFKPRFNSMGKDDKSWNYLIITVHETFPRLLTVRGKDLSQHLRQLEYDAREERDTSSAKKRSYESPYFGPFVHGLQFKEALKIIRTIFPYYDTARPVEGLRARNDRKLRFNETIGVFPSGSTTAAMYRETVRHIRMFFEGKKTQLVRDLERAMHRYAAAQDFERAGEMKRQIAALRHVNDVSLIRREPSDTNADRIRIEGYDVAHLQGTNMVGVMTVVEGGETVPSAYRTFTIRTVTHADDTNALAEILERRLGHSEWQYPRLIVVDGGRAQRRAAEAALAAAGVTIPVVAVTKDEQHRPKRIVGPVAYRARYLRDILLANAEAHRFSLATHTKRRRSELRTHFSTP